MAGLSPYLTEHISRFGEYEFDMAFRPKSIPTDVFQE
jgi:hypothetical protein